MDPDIEVLASTLIISCKDISLGPVKEDLVSSERRINDVR